MTSWYPRNNGRAGRRRMLAASMVAAMLILGDAWSDGAVRGLARISAAWTYRSATATLEWVSGWGFFSSRRALAAENAALRAALSTAEERAALTLALGEENAALRSLVSLPKHEEGVTAPVVSSFRSSPYGTFLIGVGEEGGVGEGDLVLSGSGFVIGVVTDSTPRSALITAVLSPGGGVSAIVSGVSVGVEGKGGGNGRAEAPRDAKIQSGDVVVAPEYGGRPIGVVGEAVLESGDAAQTLYIRLPVNLEGLRFLYVVNM